MLNEKEILKSMILNYFEENADILYMDKSKRESFKAYISKNKQGEFIIFDKNSSIEIIFDEANMALFKEQKPTSFNIDSILGSILYVKSFNIKISSNPDINKGTFNFRVKLLVEEFDNFPANSKINLEPPKNINYDNEVQFKLAEYFHKINKANVELAVMNEQIINKYLNSSFYEKQHEYKFDDFNFLEDIKIVNNNNSNQESVNLLHLCGKNSELKNKSFQNNTPTKKLEYFNKAKQLESALKKQEEIKQTKIESNFPKAKTNDVYSKKKF